MKKYIGNEVWTWPEFVAFAKRLGVDLNKPTKRLVITIANGEMVVVDHGFVVEDQQ
jgi:sugar diacid utilization regulator